MKKYLSVLCAICMLAAMTSCGDNDSSSRTRRKDASSKSASSEKDSDDEDDDDDDKDKDKDNKDDDVDDDKDSVDFDADDFFSDDDDDDDDDFDNDFDFGDDGNSTIVGSTTIDEKVIWETSNIKLTAKSIEDSYWGPVVKILVENTSDKDFILTSDAAVINGFMVEDYTYLTVTAGNKVNDEIEFTTDELEAAGIGNIGEIEMFFRIYDPDSYEDIESSGSIKLQTSSYADMDTEVDTNGTVIADESDVKVVAQKITEDSYGDQALVFYIENNSSKIMNFDIDDISVNGFMISSFFYEELYPGTKKVAALNFYSDDLEENDIDKIEKVEMSLEVYDDEDYETVLEVEKAVFENK